MIDESQQLTTTLKTVFGFDDLREAQKPIVSTVMKGQDILAIMKTSGGKSLCYQLPAIHRGGLTLVISPLISLMKDQVDALRSKGVEANLVNSGLSEQDQAEAYSGLASGRYRLFYVAPERFSDRSFLQALKTSGIHTVAIDEAHCASQWGHDFRPHYSKVGDAIDQLEQFLGRPLQRIAFTATATPRVQKDIMDILGLRDPVVHQQGFDRENITYTVVQSANNRDEDIEAVLRENPEQGTIIYCVTVKRVEELTKRLRKAGLPVERYHGQLDNETKNRVQDDFTQNRIPILISTAAFGMGVDKSDIRLVIHAQMPGSLEAWYQEAGRAGRDSLPSKAMLFYDPGDRRIHRFFFEMGVPEVSILMSIRRMLHQMLSQGPHPLDPKWLSKISRDNITPMQVSAAIRFLASQNELVRIDEQVYAIDEWKDDPDYAWVDEIRRNNWQKLNAMTQWCETTLCRRWTVLKYFGEDKPHSRCGACDTCHAEELAKSRTSALLPYVRPETMKALLTGLGALGAQWRAVLLGTLPGSQLSSVQEPWHGRFSQFAVGDLERWIKRLIEQGMLSEDLKKTATADAWIDGKWEDKSVIDRLCLPPSRPDQPTSVHGVMIATLHKWRRTQAYRDDISEMAIGTEALLRKVLSARTFSDDDLAHAQIPARWIDQYGASLREHIQKISQREELSL